MQELRHTRALRHLLQKCATCTDFVAKSRTTLSQHRYSSHFATMLQNLFHVFVASFSIHLHACMVKDEPIG